jgi:hypothetical protein
MFMLAPGYFLIVAMPEVPAQSPMSPVMSAVLPLLD